jgi:hypothetical protein
VMQVLSSDQETAVELLIARATTDVGSASAGPVVRALRRWVSCLRSGRERTLMGRAGVGTRWQDVSSYERPGWRARGAYVAGSSEPVFEIDYEVCQRCGIGWVEQPYTLPAFQRRGLASAGLASLPPDACRVCRALQHKATAPSAAAASATSGSACPRANLRQNPASTGPRRTDQRLRARGLKPLVRDPGRILESDRSNFDCRNVPNGAARTGRRAPDDSYPLNRQYAASARTRGSSPGRSVGANPWRTTVKMSEMMERLSP